MYLSNYTLYVMLLGWKKKILCFLFRRVLGKPQKISPFLMAGTLRHLAPPPPLWQPEYFCSILIWSEMARKNKDKKLFLPLKMKNTYFS